MRIRLRPLDQQVIVITGASSGIGFVTAKRAARAGAKVVLAARSERDLQRASWVIEAEGGEATHCVVDVASRPDVERLADTALAIYGRIDTWVNNAGVALSGKLADVPLDAMRRQFDVLYWGTVHGSLAALPYLSDHGGALINLGSVLSDRAVPLQGNYAAAKHAIKGFTDALRMELEHDRVPVAVTLIKPSTIATPLFEKAASYTGRELDAMAPIYAPDLVADAILEAAIRPMRSVTVGPTGAALRLGEFLAPRVTDRVMTRTAVTGQLADYPVESDEGNLWHPTASDGGERGTRDRGRVRRRSAWTAAQLNPGRTALVVGGLVGLALGVQAALAGRGNADR